MRDFNRGGGDKKFGKRSFGGGGGRDGGRPPMHRATCSECGNSCEVPFKPTGDRPVYCNDCFKKGDNSGASRDRDFNRDSRPSARPERPMRFDRSEDRNYRDSGFNRDFGRDSKPAMHSAICSECGNTCEVPFKPTGEKPIFCNNCFKKGGNAGNKGGGEQFKGQLDALNAKLDKILKLLGESPTHGSPAAENKPTTTQEKVKSKEAKQEPMVEKKEKADKKVKAPKAKKEVKKSKKA